MAILMYTYLYLQDTHCFNDRYMRSSHWAQSHHHLLYWVSTAIQKQYDHYVPPRHSQDAHRVSGFGEKYSYYSSVRHDTMRTHSHMIMHHQNQHILLPRGDHITTMATLHPVYSLLSTSHHDDNIVFPTLDAIICVIRVIRLIMVIRVINLIRCRPFI